jgi:hypothetical protein
VRKTYLYNRRTIVVITTSALLIGLAGTAASADDGQGVANAAADAISQVAPDVALRQMVAAPGGELTADVAGAQANVPAAGDDAIELTPVGGTAALVSIGLPEVVASAEAVVAADGTVVYAGEDAVDVAVQATSDSLRVQSILRDNSAPTAYEYPIGAGIAPILNDDGSVSLTVAGQSAGPSVELGQFAAPWAFDATGASVGTNYRVVGNTVIQEVDHRVEGITYPVVADPSVSLGWRIYVRYSPAETKSLTSGWIGAINDKQKYTAIICLAIPNLVGAAACAYYVYDAIDSIMTTAKTAASRGKGLEIQFSLAPPGLPLSWFVRE